MNNIDTLIAQLCPDGVEFRKLGDIGELVRGTGLQKSDFIESGVGCIHYGQIYTHFGIFANETKTYVSPELAKKLKKVQKSDLIITTTSENVEDVCKPVAWLGDEEIVTGGHATIFKHNENAKYLAYNFLTLDFFKQKKMYARGAKVTEISKDNLAKIKIPLPPLPIQQEIVNILDKFTQLEAELQAELEARRKQYEYYRNEFFRYENDEVEWMTLGEVCEKTENIKWKENSIEEFQYIDLTSVSRENNKISETQTINSTNAPSRAQQIVNTDDVIFGTTRPTLKRYSLITSKFHNQICSTGFCVLRANQKLILPKYLFFILTTVSFSNYVENKQEGASYPSISNSMVKKYKTLIPPLTEQQRIVSILEKFDGLVNDISEGLPAEIEARCKQYEYYRGKLLDFKNVNNG